MSERRARPTLTVALRARTRYSRPGRDRAGTHGTTLEFALQGRPATLFGGLGSLHGGKTGKLTTDGQK